MPLLNIIRGQEVRVPALQMPNGQPFVGHLKASDGENLVLELNDAASRLPEHLEELYVLTWQEEGVQRACPIIVRSHSPRGLVAQVVIQERREAPRMRIDMQMVYEMVPANLIKETADDVLSRVNLNEEPLSESLNLLSNNEDPIVDLQGEVAQLREIIQELVMNVADLTAIVVGGTPPQAPANQPRTPLAVMNCSSTGIGIIATEGVQEGDYLRITLTLRTIPKTVIECVGVVVRSTKLEKREGERGEARRYDLGIRFTHIHESDRERLIHYLFKVQRKLLRDLKEAREATNYQQKKSLSAV